MAGVSIGKANGSQDPILALGSQGTEIVATGITGGAYSLASIANRDRNGNPCMGYSNPQPDRILSLQQDYQSLSIEVDSNGRDTTLFIQSQENNDIRCAFGKNQNRDAKILDRNWSAGTYYVWVGSMNPNQRSPYRLSVRSSD